MNARERVQGRGDSRRTRRWGAEICSAPFCKVAGTPQGSLHYCRLLNCGSVFSTGKKCETYTAPSYVQSKIHQPRLDINAARTSENKTLSP